MRPPPSYESSFIQNYDQNNAENTIGGFFLHKSHELLENSIPLLDGIETILEVGAGTGHHFPFVQKSFSKYIMTDGSAEMLSIATEKYPKEISSRLLQIEQQDTTRLSYTDNSFDRLIAAHVLEHIPNPVNVLKEWDRVVRPGGVISIVLPCDPGLLWRLGRHFGPRRNAQKIGLNYDYLMAAEHINSIFNLVIFIRHHFEAITENWYPAKVPFPDLNLFYMCHIRTPQN